MTHPLTPREKVALKPCPMCGMSDSDDNATQESGLHIQSFRSPAGGDACRVQCVCGASGPSSREDWQAAEKWNRRAALASGSGDHAELARLAESLMDDARRVADMPRNEKRDEQAGYSALASVALTSLLAENTALRARLDAEATSHVSAKRQLAAEYNRATEAGRKLAGAVGLLTRWLNTRGEMSGPGTVETLTSTFLSKEAERG